MAEYRTAAAWRGRTDADAVESAPDGNGDLRLLSSVTVAVLHHYGEGLRALRFFLRSAVHWSSIKTWYRFVWSDPVICAAPEFVRTVMLDKVHRPFARKGLSVRGRGQLLHAHYQLLCECFPPATVQALLSGYRYPLAGLTGARSGQEYLVTLSREILSQHQGELTILVLDPELKSALVRMPMNLSRNSEGRAEITITGIQSVRPEHKDQIVSATRDLCGLRPKQVAIEAVFALAEYLDAARIIATARKNHVSQSRRHWRRKIHTDYDGFWSEFSLEMTAEHDFLLSATAHRRREDQVPARKLSLWRKRQVLLRALNMQVHKNLRLMSWAAEAWQPQSHQTLFLGRQSDDDMDVFRGRRSPWVMELISGSTRRATVCE